MVILKPSYDFYIEISKEFLIVRNDYRLFQMDDVRLPLSLVSSHIQLQTKNVKGHAKENLHINRKEKSKKVHEDTDE